MEKVTAILILTMLSIIQKIKNIKGSNRGFSLIELLVVISIIGVLTAILMSNFIAARDKAKDAQKIQDLTSFKNALRLYYNDHQTYPPTIGSSATSLSGFSAADQAELLKNMPGVAGIGYTYYQRNGGDAFNLCVGLDSGSGDDDINSQIKCGVGSTDVCNLGVVNGVGVTADKLFVVCGQ